MTTRRKPVLVATRVTERERALIDAVAEKEGVTISELLRRIVLQAVYARLARELDAIGA